MFLPFSCGSAFCPWPSRVCVCVCNSIWPIHTFLIVSGFLSLICLLIRLKHRQQNRVKCEYQHNLRDVSQQYRQKRKDINKWSLSWPFSEGLSSFKHKKAQFKWANEAMYSMVFSYLSFFLWAAVTHISISPPPFASSSVFITHRIWISAICLTPLLLVVFQPNKHRKRDANGESQACVEKQKVRE